MEKESPHLLERLLEPTQSSEQPARWYHYVVQPLIVMLFIFAVLYFFRNSISDAGGSADLLEVKNTILWALGISSLASSAYIVFTQPHSHSGNGIVLIASYLIAFLVGALIHWLLEYMLHAGSMFHIENFFRFASMASVGVSLTLWMMLLFRLTHPPAASVTIVLIIDMQNYYTIAVIAIAAICLAVIHLLLRPFLRKLA